MSNLVECPDCGRSGLSRSADRCPFCRSPGPFGSEETSQATTSLPRGCGCAGGAFIVLAAVNIFTRWPALVVLSGIGLAGLLGFGLDFLRMRRLAESRRPRREVDVVPERRWWFW